MKTALTLIAALATAYPALAGPYDQPYAMVESGNRSGVRKELPTHIGSIDGESTSRDRRSHVVAPGKRQVEIYLPTRVAPTAKRYRVVEIDATACVRYRIVARYDNLTHIEWTPVVYSEPIGECSRKFKRAG